MAASPMAISSYSAAKEVCALGSWKITNQQLHKNLYILQMLYMGRHDGGRLIDANFEAWDFGPVIPDLYHRCSMFGRTPIHNMFFGASPITDIEQSEFIAKTYESLGRLTPESLVAVTHWRGGAWAKHYKPEENRIVIPDSDIMAEYRERVNVKQ